MNIRLLAFGQIAEYLGYQESTTDHLPDTNALHKHLLEVCPELRHVSFVLAVNRKIIHQNQPFQEGDEVAVLPPFSGG